MSKTFYTERDVEDLARRGVHSLTLNDEVVLTELALEKAQRLGITLQREHETPPSAPVRPYISAVAPRTQAGEAGLPAGQADLHQRVRSAVINRLGGELDPVLLDSIIRRVLENVGMK